MGGPYNTEAMPIIKPIILPLCLFALTAMSFAARERPNILWITSEDNAAHWLGCYGNKQAETPRMDALAKEGVQFLHAYSNAPVCAVARATLINGAYAVTMGTQHMRSRHAIPEKYRSYVSCLREQGYYCTNRAKTDFNFMGKDSQMWDECSRKGHYKNRAKGQPFFAIINLTSSHESSLFPKRRRSGSTRLKPSQIEVPPYLPDLPEVRGDFASYYDIMTRLDTQVGALLDELEQRGLAEDTIVFYYGDHGGPTPRGKRYLKDTGVRVPLLIRVPEKWRHLSSFKPGEKVAEPVGFVDFAPTLLSLIGQEKPKQMQGRAFLGKHRLDPPENDMVFLYADRFDEIYGMRRGMTDGRWKYLRKFTPNLTSAPYSFYQFSMPSWVAWRKAWQDGKVSGIHKDIWEKPQLSEELFDLEADPWEVRNLAADPGHAKRLANMRQRLKGEMKDAWDTGLVPEPMFNRLTGDGTIAAFVRSDQFDFTKILDLAFIASSGKVGGLPRLQAALNSSDPVERYWGLHGMLVLGDAASGSMDAIAKALKDQYSVNRVTAAEALMLMERQEEGEVMLVAELLAELNEQEEMYVCNALRRSGLNKEIPDAWVKKILNSKKAGNYVKRYAGILKEERMNE